MNIIDICKQNALHYSDLVCRPVSEYGNIFPEYFDWADHIASSDSEDYLYHLNKVVSDVEALVDIFQGHIPETSFQAWKEEWYEQTIAAAWIHDIGMVEERGDHEIFTASFLFKNKLGFKFEEIEPEDKIKIGLICLKHNKGWTHVYDKMKKILEKNGIAGGALDEYFDQAKPADGNMVFSGKLISAADSLRTRGAELRNNLKNSFQLWSECGECKTAYKEMREFCSTPNCPSQKPSPKAAVDHYVDKIRFDSDEFQDIALFSDNSKNPERIQRPISDAHVKAMVREEYQLFTIGDMSLLQIGLVEFNVWYNNLIQNGVDCDAIDDYTFNERYKTVIQATVDDSKPGAAIFTLSKYIMGHLHENLCIEEDEISPVFINNAILDIRVSTGQPFYQFFKSIDRSTQKGRVMAAMTAFESTCKKWSGSHHVVLPVELTQNKLEVIRP